jgi:NAD-reducing hydrogenase small subunit
MSSADDGKLRFATVWLAGCSGCHMSFLDLDEWLVELAERVELVFGPLTDAKTFPEGVDLTLVEGAVANTDNLELARQLRARSRVVVSFGDCAVTGNVTALRNGRGEPDAMLRRVYVEAPDLAGQLPRQVVPTLLPEVRPLHEVIAVDVYLPGCPPSADRIRDALTRLLVAVEAGGPLPEPDAFRGDGPRFG